eukprot:TRINITY_DN17547_c0_g5_i1.p1 TRINITY_DN17547_c0_g5~~TRINITY_DN17547_c0_g5_i1.p1  ORF type:complete len:534 (-),score=134.06 TRINITY_DN17547_c0_g5_i1:146-1711(-)
MSGEVSEDLEVGTDEDDEGCLDTYKRALTQKPSVTCVVTQLSSLAACLWLLVGIAILSLLKSRWSENDWLLAGSLILLALSSSSIIFVGSDPCLLDHLRKSVGMFQVQNTRLEKNNSRLEGELHKLGSVSNGLAKVQQDLGGDANAAEEILHELERIATLQAVSSALNLFFANDFDNSGVLEGDEAELFLSGFQQLWELVPDFDQERLEGAFEDSHLDIQQLSALLGAVVQEDAEACRKELEDLCGLEEVDSDEEQTYAAVIAFHAAPRALPMLEMKKVTAREVKREAKEVSSDDEDGPTMEPLFQIGQLKVWSAMHLTALVLGLVSVLMSIRSLVVFEAFTLVIDLLIASLSGSLTLYAQLAVIAPALRSEVHRFSRENAKLENSIADLSDQVSKLQKMKKGLEALEGQFAGDARRAQKLVKKQGASTKSSAVAVIMNLFKRADEDGNGNLSGDEVDAFIAELEKVFSHVPGFDSHSVRDYITEEGLTAKGVKSLVDLIAQPSDVEDAAAKASQALTGGG